MTESTQFAASAPETASRRRSNFFQWNIATLLLLMAVVGVWTSYFRMKSETVRMEAELGSLRQLARELVVNDRNQYAIVERHEEWYGDRVWDVHLPEGNRYVLKLATREINRPVGVPGIAKDDFPHTDHFVILDAGQHVISLKKKVTEKEGSASAIVDGKLAIEVLEADDWYPGGGYSSGGNYDRAAQAAVDKPLELIRIRFQKPGTQGINTPDEPYNGVSLWIERKE